MKWARPEQAAAGSFQGWTKQAGHYSNQVDLVLKGRPVNPLTPHARIRAAAP
jgi:hypothetical protein